MKRYYRCVDNSWGNITRGKLYEGVVADGERLKIVDDDGKKSWYLLRRFVYDESANVAQILKNYGIKV